MKEVTGDIWDYYDKGNWVVITTNGTVKANGEAVMGKGIALQAKQRFPEFPKILGGFITRNGNRPHPFRLIRIITFPVKYYWAQKADISLIEDSCMELVEGMKLLALEVVYMVRPGCGVGGLVWKDVKPILEKYLDDRFIVVERKI
jgi:hypothetical protein